MHSTEKESERKGWDGGPRAGRQGSESALKVLERGAAQAEVTNWRREHE